MIQDRWYKKELICGDLLWQDALTDSLRAVRFRGAGVPHNKQRH